jgi:hypothetical protein
VRPGEISVQDIGRWMSGLWPQQEMPA